MDYNKEVIAGNAQAEVKDLVESYPRYAKEIMDIVPLAQLLNQMSGNAFLFQKLKYVICHAVVDCALSHNGDFS